MLFDDVSKIGVLGQKTITGMDGVGVGYRCRRDESGNIKIAFGCRRRTDTNAFIGEAYMHRFGVGG